MATFPVPLNSLAEFEALFASSECPGPSSLPVPNPTRSFWSAPGLSTDWSTHDTKDPDAYNTTNPYAREGSNTALPAQVDLVIIGSGITGVSLALELSRLARAGESKHMTVAILEARDFCSGATARNGGHLTAAISHQYSALARLYDPEEVKRCFALERHTVSAILELIKREGWSQHVDLVEGGHNVLMFSDEEYGEAKADYQKALEAGIVTREETEWLTPEATEKKYGATYPMYRWAGHNLWPLKLVIKMFELARDGPGSTVKTSTENLTDPSPVIVSGMRRLLDRVLSFQGSSEQPQIPSTEAKPPSGFHLTLHTNAPVNGVESIDHHGELRWRVKTNRGSVTTKRVVYATNAYTSHLLPHLAGPFGIVPVRGQVVAIRASVGYIDEGWDKTGKEQGLTRSGWSGNEGFEYWFPRPHPPLRGSIELSQTSLKGPRKPLVILGGARETMKDRGYGMYETDDSKLDPEASAGLRAFLGTVFPGKFPGEPLKSDSGGDGVEVEWTGIMGFTASGDPFVGRAKDAEGRVLEGQYICAGFTGHGMPRAYGCAQALAGLIWSDATNSNWSPPDWLPRHYLTEPF